MFIESAAEMALTIGNPFVGNALGAANEILGNRRPMQIVDFLEDYWRQGVAASLPFQFGVAPGDIASHQEEGRPLAIDVVNVNGPLVPSVPVWHHLVYAYMLENTRMYEIFRRVVTELLQGERLPHATQPTLRWARNCEELFFSTPRMLTVRSVLSGLRIDDGAVRRNLYQRAIGMDLNHGGDDGRPYPYVRAAAANGDFATLWETLLSEVWRGFTTTAPAFAAVNETDDAAIATLVRRIEEMLRARRLNGMLSREEFDAVACLSWFHLTITDNTQVIVNLSAQAAGEADRLKQLGSMVGISAHSRADAYFQLAAPMSRVLRSIESGAAGALPIGGLYDPAIAGNLSADMLTIITNWSIATGRNMKDPSFRATTLPVLTEAARSQPVSSNGRGPNAAPAASRIPASAWSNS
jgi:hypothetical protein